MNTRLLTLPALFLATVAAHALAADITIKPGLWEITSQMQGGSGDKMAASMAKMQKDMEKMTPEQRKMVQDMMAKQGVQMGSSGASGVTVKICMIYIQLHWVVHLSRLY